MASQPLRPDGILSGSYSFPSGGKKPLLRKEDFMKERIFRLQFKESMKEEPTLVDKLVQWTQKDKESEKKKKLDIKA